MVEGSPQEPTREDIVTPNLLVIAEEEFRAIVHSVAEELRRERSQLRGTLGQA
ncbi:MAG: hypothetical protein HY329_22630 [Chloroflexi bacterium]|nr:hypothetical protein [Chloroflexota bacterium]